MAASTTASRLGAFALVLVGAFGTAYAVGERLPGHAHSSTGTDHGDHGDHGGSAATGSGYGLVVVDYANGEVALQVQRNGTAVVDFGENHGALMHLIAIRRDLSGFQHVHPVMAADGTWTAALDLGTPGAWRLVADTAPTAAGSAVVLDTDVFVSGDAPVVDLGPATPLDGSGTVPTAAGTIVQRNGLEFTVEPATGLEPYLGEAAHLVAFRVGDLAYAHLHAHSAHDGDPPGVFRFDDTLPGPGTYRLVLEFARAGAVESAEFMIEVP